MSSQEIYSTGKYFEYDQGRSQVIDETTFYRYLTQKEEKEGIPNEDKTVYLIFKPQEIVFKKEIETKANGTYVETLLVIPLNSDPSSNLALAIDLIRLKKKEKDPKIEELLKNFIEDLYVNKYFKEQGNSLQLTIALEKIPILHGIISQFLFYFYVEKIKKNNNGNEETKEKEEWKEKILIHHFEDAYLKYSLFLSQISNEKYFAVGGWFVEANKDKSKKIDCIDSELEKIESEFLSIEKIIRNKEENKNGVQNLIYTQPVNFNQILKRYGIKSILKITTSAVWSEISVGILFLVVGLISLDNILFNINVNPVNSKFKEIEKYIENGLYIVSLAFLILTFTLGLWLWLKYKSRVIPGIFLPRLVIAIISGWLIFFSTEELFKIDMSLAPIPLLLIAVVTIAITITFMVFEIRSYAPSMPARRIWGRSIVVTSLAFVISYTFGFWFMTHIINKSMSIDNYVVNESTLKKEIEEREKYYSEFINGYNIKMAELINSDTLLHSKISLKSKEIKTEKNRRTEKRELKITAKINSPFERLDSIIYKDLVSKLLNSIDDIRDIEKELTSHTQNLNYKIRIYNAFIDSVKNYEKSVIISKNNDSYKDSIQSDTYQLSYELPFNRNKSAIVTKITSPQHSIDTTYSVSLKESVNTYVFEYMANNPSIEVNKMIINYKEYKIPIIGPLLEDAFGPQIVFPNMLLARALLAMFIGIFFQLIVQDKTITEAI